MRSPPLYGGEYRGGRETSLRRACLGSYRDRLCALTESVFGLLPGSSLRSYRERVRALTEIVFGLLPRSSLSSYREHVRALTEIAETSLPRAPLRSRYVRFCLLGTSDTEEVVWAIASWFVLSGGGELARADA